MTSSATFNARSHLAIALDLADVDQAISLVEAVRDSMAVAKVGLQLYSAVGPLAVDRVRAAGMDVFLDAKLHDIPNTVGAAARELGRLGARYVTAHAAGGVPMLRAAVEGLAEGADTAGMPAAGVLAITVLTSMPDATDEVLTERVGLAAETGCAGVVCAVPDLPVVTTVAPADLLVVTPGIRPAGTDAGDQARVATPSAAIAAGSGLLVVGRPISKADEPGTAAREIAREIAQSIT